MYVSIKGSSRLSHQCIINM